MSNLADSSGVSADDVKILSIASGSVQVRSEVYFSSDTNANYLMFQEKMELSAAGNTDQAIFTSGFTSEYGDPSVSDVTSVETVVVAPLPPPSTTDVSLPPSTVSTGAPTVSTGAGSGGSGGHNLDVPDVGDGPNAVGVPSTDNDGDSSSTPPDPQDVTATTTATTAAEGGSDSSIAFIIGGAGGGLVLILGSAAVYMCFFKKNKVDDDNSSQQVNIAPYVQTPVEHFNISQGQPVAGLPMMQPNTTYPPPGQLQLDMMHSPHMHPPAPAGVPLQPGAHPPIRGAHQRQDQVQGGSASQPPPMQLPPMQYATVNSGSTRFSGDDNNLNGGLTREIISVKDFDYDYDAENPKLQGQHPLSQPSSSSHKVWG